MLQNNTQTMLLANQQFLAQPQQNRQQLFTQNQQLLIPNQQTLAQIQQNNMQLGLISGQASLINAQQNIPQPINIYNQIPIVQPQLNNIQPPIIKNQTTNIQPPLNNVKPTIIKNQTPIKQLQLNNAQLKNIQNQPSLENENKNVQTKIENNETNSNLGEEEYLQSVRNELKDSEYADIEYSRELNKKKVFKSIYNFHNGELFEIYLGKGDYKKNSFICTEKSEYFQRYCVGTSKREFEMDMFYNISDEEPEFTKNPILKIHRVEGGCCSGRGILIVNYPNDKKRLGIILQAFLANIYDANNQLLYRVKLPFEPEHKSFFQRFCESCCGCGKNETEEEKDYSNFLIKKLVEREEQVEDIIVKKNVQVTVGKMENYPLRIIFPKDASPKEKMLLIICRIFILYMMNFSETLREKWYETCKDIGKDIVESQEETILGKFSKIKEYKENFDKLEEFCGVLETTAINKNIVSLNNYLDD